MALIKIQALLTIRTQAWLTRQVAVENGEVVRTAAAEDGPPHNDDGHEDGHDNVIPLRRAA